MIVVIKGYVIVTKVKQLSVAGEDHKVGVNIFRCPVVVWKEFLTREGKGKMPCDQVPL